MRTKRVFGQEECSHWASAQSHCVISSCTLHVSNHTSALGQMPYPSWHVARSYLFPDFPGISEPLKNNHTFINFDKCVFLLSPPKTNYAKRTRTCNQTVKNSLFPHKALWAHRTLFVSCTAVFHIPPFLVSVSLPAAGPRRLFSVLWNLLIKSADWKTPGTGV